MSTMLSYTFAHPHIQYRYWTLRNLPPWCKISSIVTESNAPRISKFSLEDSRKSVAQPSYYDGPVRIQSNGNPLAIRREIETAYSPSMLECVSNSPLGDYPYLEQIYQRERLSTLENLPWLRHLTALWQEICYRDWSPSTKSRAPCLSRICIGLSWRYIIFSWEIWREMKQMIGRYLSLLPDLTSKMCTIPVSDTVAKYFPSILNAA